MPRRRVKRSIHWSEESLNQLIAIRDELSFRFGEHAVDWLERVILRFAKTVLVAPKAFPRSTSNPAIRKGLMHPHISALYRLDGKRVEVITIIQNSASND